jgi:uncharacterized membrane protein YfcA
VIPLLHWPVLLLATSAVLTGSLVQGTTGLGLGMVAAPVLLMIDPRLVPGPLLVLALLLSTLIAAREWRSIDRRGLSIALIGRLLGSVVAGITISRLPLYAYDLIFGILVLGAVLLSATGWHVLPTARNLLTAGFASGYMGTLTSIGAPPMALAYQHGTPASIRSTMSVYFVVGSIFSIGVLASLGRFRVEQAVAGALLMPAVIAGFGLSRLLVAHMNRRVTRYAILWLSGTSAMILIAKASLGS